MSDEQPTEEKQTSMQDDLAARREASNQKTLARIEQERREMDEVSRFGFFSIPYPQTVGDKAYSTNAEYKHKVEDRKVIIEKRGIYVQPPRKGKGNDVYLKPIPDLTEDQLNDIKARKKADDDKYLEIVKDRREKKGSGPTFKYPGPQEMFGFYKGEESYKPDGPLYKEKDRFRFIHDRKVITEKRGIYANPAKAGTNLIPNDYFSYYYTTDKIQEMVKKKAEAEKKQKENEIEARKDPKNYRKPFAPASLKKCDCFASASETYGIKPEDHLKGLEEFREFKKNGRSKYVKTLPSGSIKHLKAFSPPKLISTGRACLFDDNLYTLHTYVPKAPNSRELDEKEMQKNLRERREFEQKNKKKAFTYNKLMDNSNFAPAISSFKVNLKRDFPSIRFY